MKETDNKVQTAFKQEPVIRIDGHQRIHVISMCKGHEHKRIPVHIEVKRNDNAKDSEIIIKP